MLRESDLRRDFVKFHLDHAQRFVVRMIVIKLNRAAQGEGVGGLARKCERDANRR